MFGFLAGGLAVAWGVTVAFLDQPSVSSSRRTQQLCTALLIALAAVLVAGGVTTAIRS